METWWSNEDEAKAYTGFEEEDALKKMSEYAELVIVKLGKKGALISNRGEITRINAEIVNAIDTTGAGDLWASGFLYGITHNYSMESAGVLGAKVASEVVQPADVDRLPRAAAPRDSEFLAAVRL